MEEQIECLDSVAAANSIDVAESFCRKQGRVRTLALEYRVDRDGRAVQNFGQRTRIAMCKAETLRHAGCGIGGYRRRLRRHHLAVDDADQIRERSSDINTDNIHRAWSLSSLARPCASGLTGARRCERTR